jgi:hypothetical protein
MIPSAIGRQSKKLQFIQLKPKIYSDPRPKTTHFISLAKNPCDYTGQRNTVFALAQELEILSILMIISKIYPLDCINKHKE